MRKIISFVVLAMLLTQIAQAQVKRQYQDEKFEDQTVVIKEEASISDIDILNSEFDLEEVKVGEVIRITTETDPQQAQAIPEATPETEEILVLVEPKVEELEQASPEKPEAEEAPATKTKEKFRGIYPRKSNVKGKNPRFKKKKRKKRKKRKKDKCYRF